MPYFLLPISYYSFVITAFLYVKLGGYVDVSQPINRGIATMVAIMVTTIVSFKEACGIRIKDALRCLQITPSRTFYFLYLQYYI